MKKIIFSLLVLCLFIVGCDYIQEGITKDQEKAKETQMVEVPEVCNELTEEFSTVETVEEPYFAIEYNDLGNGYEYSVKMDDYNTYPENFHKIGLRDISFYCPKGTEVGQNTNYFYCEPIDFRKEEKVINEGGIVESHVLYFYIIKDMILEFDTQQSNVYKVVSRKCFRWKVVDYGDE